MAGFSLEEFDFSSAKWTSGSEAKAQTFNRMTEYPAELLEPVLRAIRNGMTFAQAAMAGGLSPGELEYIVELGRQGHPAFEDFRDAVLRADYMSVEPTMMKMKAEGEQGSLPHARQYMKMKSREYRIFENAEAAKNNGQGDQKALPGGINIQINTGFGEAPKLDRGDDIDAEEVEEL